MASKRETPAPFYLYTSHLGLRIDGVCSQESKQQNARQRSIFTHNVWAFALLVCCPRHQRRNTPVHFLSLHMVFEASFFWSVFCGVEARNTCPLSIFSHGFWAFALMECVPKVEATKHPATLYLYTWCLGLRCDGLRSPASKQDKTHPLRILTHGSWDFALLVCVPQTQR